MSPAVGFLLGLVQGLTEFLPVSSSGHLVLVEHLLGAHEATVAFEVLLHVATLLAAMIELRPELGRISAFLASSLGIRWVSLRSDDLREGRRLFFALVIGTIPAVAAGLLFKPAIEAFFDSPRFVGFALLFTGAVLLGTRFAPRGQGPIDMGSALAIGLAQALALLPGVSRSGMTLAAGLFSGIKRERVVRFSFLLSLPAILGASLLQLRDGASLAGIPPVTLVVAFVTALVSGWVAMQVLLRVVIAGRLSLFGLYCLAVGTAALLLLPRFAP
jgi:undecaprenyl-diphosphatase